MAQPPEVGVDAGALALRHPALLLPGVDDVAGVHPVGDPAGQCDDRGPFQLGGDMQRPGHHAGETRAGGARPGPGERESTHARFGRVGRGGQGQQPACGPGSRRPVLQDRDAEHRETDDEEQVHAEVAPQPQAKRVEGQPGFVPCDQGGVRRRGQAAELADPGQRRDGVLPGGGDLRNDRADLTHGHPGGERQAKPGERRPDTAGEPIPGPGQRAVGSRRAGLAGWRGTRFRGGRGGGFAGRRKVQPMGERKDRLTDSNLARFVGEYRVRLILRCLYFVVLGHECS